MTDMEDGGTKIDISVIRHEGHETHERLQSKVTCLEEAGA